MEKLTNIGGNLSGWWAARRGDAPVFIVIAVFFTLVFREVVLAREHRVEMRYVAPAARAGASISAFTLLPLGGLAIYDWRARRRSPKAGSSNIETYNIGTKGNINHAHHTKQNARKPRAISCRFVWFRGYVFLLVSQSRQD